MDELKAYIVSGDVSLMPTAAQLDKLVERYPWFTMARVLRSRASGAVDPIAALALTGKPMPRAYMREVATRRPDPTVGIIDSFLGRAEHTTPGKKGEVGADYSAGDEAGVGVGIGVGTEAGIGAAKGDQRDEVSEELAEIYLAQGLNKLAVDVYRKLSLLYPKKSVYFAAIIERIEKHKQ